MLFLFKKYHYKSQTFKLQSNYSQTTKIQIYGNNFGINFGKNNFYYFKSEKKCSYINYFLIL